MEKIRDSFEIFDRNKDRIEVVYKMQDDLLEDLSVIDHKACDLYRSYGLPSGTDTVDTTDIDAYYGEPSMYAAELAATGKPVLLIQTCR